MSDQSIEVFDKFGKIRADFSDEELESIGPERHDRFIALVNAAHACTAAENDAALATKAIEAAARAVQAARAQLERVRPRLTHAELVKQYIASNR